MIRTSGATFTLTAIGPITIPANAKVGDELQITAIARVIGIEEDLVDITSYGRGPELTGGSLRISLGIRDLQAEHIA